MIDIGLADRLPDWETGGPSSRRMSPRIDRVFVVVCALLIAIGVVVVVGIVLAAVAFANGTSIGIPLVATFDGVRDVSATPTVTITGSGVAVGVVAIVLALPLGIVAPRYPDEVPGRAGGEVSGRGSTARRSRGR